jgi:hypothetical protein
MVQTKVARIEELGKIVKERREKINKIKTLDIKIQSI